MKWLDDHTNDHNEVRKGEGGEGEGDKEVM